MLTREAELSFGKSFQAMQSGRLPEFVHDIDNVLLVRMLEYTFPPVGQLLRMMPGTRVKRFLESKDRVTAVYPPLELLYLITF